MKTYLKHRSLNVIDVKDIVALEYIDFEGKYADYVEEHNFWELCFVEEGESLLLIDGKELHLNKGDVAFIEPNTPHLYSTQNKEDTRLFVICFECTSYSIHLLSGIKFSLDENELNCQKLIIEEGSKTYLTDENDQLVLIDSPSFGGQQAIKIQLEYLLISILRKYSSKKSSGIVFLNGESFYSDLVKIIKEYLHSNVYNKLSLKDVYSNFNYSRSFICRIFKEQTGESIITYFNKLKIEESKKMLAGTQTSVTDISESLGYTESKYFSASFKSQVGMTPLEYRAKNSKGENTVVSKMTK